MSALRQLIAKVRAPGHYKRDCVMFILLFVMWLVARVYFYVRYNVLSLDPIHIPIVALFGASYTWWRFRSLIKETRK